MHVSIFPLTMLEFSKVNVSGEFFMYLSRTIEKEMPNLSRLFKVILITGMRQVGKSTTLLQLAQEDREYVNLDNFNDLELAENAPGAFFKEHPLPLIIDEIQRTPSLFLQVKAEVDKTMESGRVWISGSQRFSLMKGVGDSLAGRLCEVHLMPLSLYEREGKGLKQEPYCPSSSLPNILHQRSADETWMLIWQGAWPQVISLSAKERNLYFENFLTTFIERDIRSLSNIDKISAFRKFIYALAIRTGQELRINKLAEIAGVTESSAKRWLSVAEASGLIYLLKPFATNTTKTLTKSPKLYFTDTGLAAYLCGFTTPEEMQRDTNAGAFFETFVVMEILKSWRHHAIEPNLYFYRDAKRQTEIDLLIHADGLYFPVEIKATTSPTASMVKNFEELQKLGLRVGSGSLICNIEKSRYLTNDVIAHSLWQI